ncbi:MAG: hypothetical protein JWM93_3780, partial [Frankiales bacterium]|nr:hypothetical protein [Frankiales bacterium]
LCRECVTSEGWMSGIYLPESGIADLCVPPADSLAALRETNSMDGSETLPQGDPDDGKPLPNQAPLA